MSTSADIIFINGSVITVDPKDRICDAVAVQGNKILAVGSVKDIQFLSGVETRVIDLKGRSLLPGFVDAHCHAAMYGVGQSMVKCQSPFVNSIDDIKTAIKERVSSTPPGKLIIGRGYNHFELKEKRHPTKWDLDEVAPDHRVILVRTCGHFISVNSRVLEEFEIGSETPDPDGGRIERNSTGEPTGVLCEQAAMMIRMKTLPSEAVFQKGLKLMNRDFLSLGITSAHDANGISPEEIRAYQNCVADNSIQIRFYLMIRDSGSINPLGAIYLQTGLITGFGNQKLKLGPYKLMLDGAGSGGSAAMRDPYANNSGDPKGSKDYGILYMDQNELDSRVLKAHKRGYQVAIHAIGDRAVEMALESFEKALTKYPRLNHRHRIEHCGFLDGELINKIHRLKIIPISGLPFLYMLGDAYIGNYGINRLSNAYPLKSLLDNGIITALSSDAPVIEPNPMHGIYYAIHHKTKSGQIVAPHESVSVLQAVRAYTIAGAYASFEEDIKGSIECGKLADLVVLNGDLLNSSGQEILSMKVDLTMIDGEIVYERSIED